MPTYDCFSKLDIRKEVQLINPKKATRSDSISPKILKLSSEASAEVLKTGNFSDSMKLTDITLQLFLS